MRLVEAAIFSLGINVASALFMAGAGRITREALGEQQKRDLKEVFDRASAAMLVALVRGDVGNLELLKRYKKQFADFFGDRWVAETLLDVALEREELPVEALRERFSAMNFDPEEVSIGFGRAMATFVRELLLRLEQNASEGGSLESRVNRVDLRAIRNSVEDLARGLGNTGQDVDELERESLARCAERWEAAGLSAEEAWRLADDPIIGAPGPWLRAALGARKVAVVVGEVGAGKSLLLERLLQRAAVRLREEPNAPLPTYIEAWEVKGRLRDLVVEKTRSLAGTAGEARTRGAYVLLDGAEEEGGAQAKRLVREARVLADTWPNTTVVVAGRPLPELAEEREQIEMPTLTEAEARDSIEGILGENLTAATTYRWPESVREAIKRPLFAVLMALDLRVRASHNPRSVGELLSGLVERALGNSADAGRDRQLLRALAAATIDGGGAPLPREEVGTREDVARMLDTGFVSSRGGAVGFSLRILAEWFATQALEHGMVSVDDIASDPARLERWRYPLIMAVGSFGHDRGSTLLRPIAEAAPAFGSQLIKEGVEDGVVSFRLGREGSPMSPEEFGERLRGAMGSWVTGIGPLAPLIAPVREDGSLCTLGVSGSAERLSTRSWYRGETNLGKVLLLDEHNLGEFPNRDWPNVRGAGTRRQATWIWEYALKDLKSELQEAIKKEKLPVREGLLAKEDAWNTACGLAGEKSRRDPLPLERIEQRLEFYGRIGAEEVRLSRGHYSNTERYRLGNLRAAFASLRNAGQEELAPPWPLADRLGDPDLPSNSGGGVWVWHLYRPETLLRRARIIMEGAFAGYRRLVEDYFLKLAPQMRVAATLPARLTGTLIMSHLNEDPNRGPYVAWYLEPLPPDSENEVQIEFGVDRLAEEDFLALETRMRLARPQAAEWLSPWEHAFSDFYGKTPATDLAHKLLWEDLKRVSWVDGMFTKGM